MPLPWSHHEITQTLHHYFQMLDLEIAGQPYTKSAFRKALLPQLNHRSEGAIEFKHQNISAVLLKYDKPYIIGYKPLFNYQSLLEDMVLDYLDKRKELDQLFERFAQPKELKAPQKIDFSRLLVNPPAPVQIQESKATYTPRLRKPNYLQIEQQNRQLGQLGEELIFQYEKHRLLQADKASLADQIEWIARDAGDGAGFDILSRNENGTDRYIEVKTTTLGESTPFYFTRNELRVSQEKARDYFLYRVFQFRKGPRVFVKNGSFDEMCRFEAVSFVGRV